MSASNSHYKNIKFQRLCSLILLNDFCVALINSLIRYGCLGMKVQGCKIEQIATSSGSFCRMFTSQFKGEQCWSSAEMFFGFFLPSILK